MSATSKYFLTQFEPTIQYAIETHALTVFTTTDNNRKFGVETHDRNIVGMSIKGLHARLVLIVPNFDSSV